MENNTSSVEISRACVGTPRVYTLVLFIKLGDLMIDIGIAKIKIHNILHAILLYAPHV